MPTLYHKALFRGLVLLWPDGMDARSAAPGACLGRRLRL